MHLVAQRCDVYDTVAEKAGEGITNERAPMRNNLNLNYRGVDYVDIIFYVGEDF